MDVNCGLHLVMARGFVTQYVTLIAESMEAGWSWGLIFLHALSGCDTVSSLDKVWKKTVCRSRKHLASVFKRLSTTANMISQNYINGLERYVVLLYCRTSFLSKGNKATKHLFAHDNRLDNIPPMRGSLEQYIKCAAYRAGHILEASTSQKCK